MSANVLFAIFIALCCAGWIGTGVWLTHKNVSPKARWPYIGIALQLIGMLVLAAELGAK